MRVLKSCLIFLCISGFVFNVFSQTVTYQFPDSSFYKKGIIYFADNTRFNVKDLIVHKENLSFKIGNSSQKSEYQLNDVYLIKTSAGNHAWNYALYGGLVFAFSAALALADISSDPYVEPPPAGPFIGGFAIGGALIGGLVGLAKPKWKTLYLNNQTTSIMKYNFTFKTNSDYLGIKFILTYI